MFSNVFIGENKVKETQVIRGSRTCGRGSRVCLRLWSWTDRLIWSETSWRWWCLDRDADSPGNRTAPPAAPWWTSRTLSKCCWAVVLHHRILNPTQKHRITLRNLYPSLFLLSSQWIQYVKTSIFSLEMSSSSCQVIRLPLSAFFSELWLPRPMVIFPALFAPLTMVFDSVLWGEQSRASI